MSEQLQNNREVAIIFRKGNSLVIPPYGLDQTERLTGETFEESAIRLSGDLGVIGSVDYYLNPSLEASQSFPRGFLIEANCNGLDNHQHLVNNANVMQHIQQYYGEHTIESKLFRSALSIVNLRRR